MFVNTRGYPPAIHPNAAGKWDPGGLSGTSGNIIPKNVNRGHVWRPWRMPTRLGILVLVVVQIEVLLQKRLCQEKIWSTFCVGWISSFVWPHSTHSIVIIPFLSISYKFTSRDILLCCLFVMNLQLLGFGFGSSTALEPRAHGGGPWKIAQLTAREAVLLFNSHVDIMWY